MGTALDRDANGTAFMNRVYKSVNKPLTVLGVERRLFLLALATSVATFNLFGSLFGGLLMFALLYGLGLWASATDPEILRIALNSTRLRAFYDPHKCAAREARQ
jgi:type IV secretory pathway TrbD component